MHSYAILPDVARGKFSVQNLNIFISLRFYDSININIWEVHVFD